ncbi:MAG: hypothetical protein OHK0019_29830 [Saprospiraceae bacterium]
MIQSKSAAVVASLILLSAILWPIRENWQKEPKDAFPLSYFPMFSLKRDTTCRVNYFVGFDNRGNRVVIPYRFVGSGGFNQVRRQINKKVRQGKGDALAQKVSKRLSKTSMAPYTELKRVALCTGTYDLDCYFLKGQKTPLEEIVVAEKTIEKP